jgi:RNA polymerase sigma-70 factor (ECF subfamily)
MGCYISGDVKAFELLLERHQRAVINFIGRYIGDVSMAEDITQEVFIRVIRSADRYKRSAKFRTWLFTIARNLCIDRLRQSKRRPEVSLDNPLTNNDKEGAVYGDLMTDPNQADSEEAVIHGEFREKLKQAMATLPEKQREVFVMRQFSGLRFHEIAETLGIGENTVKSRMRYALLDLKKKLADYADLIIQPKTEES